MERGLRYEFYAPYDPPPCIDKLKPLVEAFAHLFTHYRRRQPLGE
jgi:hypothetical protein